MADEDCSYLEGSFNCVPLSQCSSPLEDDLAPSPSPCGFDVQSNIIKICCTAGDVIPAKVKILGRMDLTLPLSEHYTTSQIWCVRPGQESGGQVLTLLQLEEREWVQAGPGLLPEWRGGERVQQGHVQLHADSLPRLLWVGEVWLS